MTAASLSFGLAGLGDLAAALVDAGFNILLPLAPAAFDGACAPVVPDVTLRSLLPGAVGAVIIASGGPALFERFQASPESRDGQPHPLDRYTGRAVVSAAGGTLATRGVEHRVLFPFVGAAPVLPFQRLGRAAGLGAPGPLGLQIHPRFGPWWAYRALIALAEPARPGDTADETSAAVASSDVGDGCAGCPAPCVGACPAGAVRLTGFSVPDCHARRRSSPACRLSCAARIACVRGPEHRYTDEQLAFHMAASMPR